MLKLIKDNFHPGDKLVETKLGRGVNATSISAQAFITPTGRKLLLVNKRNTIVEVPLPDGTEKGMLLTVDEASGDGPARQSELQGSVLKLSPFSVNVINLP